MLIGNHDIAKRVFIIAEVGNNHEGDFGRAQEMVAAASEAGVDAVKFQTFRAEHYVGLSNRARFEMLKRFELSFDQFAQLKGTADRHGCVFLSTPFDLESARFLDGLVPAFKIASGDNTFTPLLELVAGFAKPVLLSCGMLCPDGIRQTANVLNSVWQRLGVAPGLAALHCVTSYPVPEEEANLSALGPMAEAIGAVPGYSDHTLGIEAAVLSVAAGARIVEKHFTLDKNLSDFRDHQLSADPGDLAAMVQRIRQAERLLGTGAKRLMACEGAVEPLVRRSVALARDLCAGTVLALNDLTWIRPGGGFPPGAEAELLGCKLTRDAAAFEVLMPEMLEI